MEKKAKQRIIRINRAQDTDRNYIKVFYSPLDLAAKHLHELASFKLFIYLLKNIDGYRLVLSSSHFTQWANVSRNAYNTAFKELERMGYLVQDEELTDIYTFYELPTNLL